MTKFMFSFVAKDADGKEVELSVYTDFIQIPTRGGVHETPGMKSIKTAEGRSVNRLDKGKYQIVGGQTLTSDDPKAP